MALSIAKADQKKIAIMVGSVVGFVAWIALFLLPQLNAWSQNRSKTGALKQKLDQTHGALAQLPNIEKELIRLRNQYELPAVTPPPEEQLPELLEMIAQAARTSQVNLLSVKPGGKLNQLSPGPTGYLELPIEVEALAGYHQFGKFLDILENSENLVRVQKLRLQSDPSDLFRHQTTLVMQAYLLPSGDAKKK